MVVAIVPILCYTSTYIVYIAPFPVVCQSAARLRRVLNKVWEVQGEWRNLAGQLISSTGTHQVCEESAVIENIEYKHCI